MSPTGDNNPQNGRFTYPCHDTVEWVSDRQGSRCSGYGVVDSQPVLGSIPNICSLSVPFPKMSNCYYMNVSEIAMSSIKRKPFKKKSLWTILHIACFTGLLEIKEKECCIGVSLSIMYGVTRRFAERFTLSRN
jgi:hypothetical protein